MGCDAAAFARKGPVRTSSAANEPRRLNENEWVRWRRATWDPPEQVRTLL